MTDSKLVQMSIKSDREENIVWIVENIFHSLCDIVFKCLFIHGFQKLILCGEGLMLCQCLSLNPLPDDKF